MKPVERPARSASVPKAGLSATLRGPFRAEGSSAPASAAPSGVGPRIARRRLPRTLLACVCAVACVLLAGAGSAVAATQFGKRGSRSGQFDPPYDVAVNQASGDLYVADRFNWRIDKFDGAGGFLRAWGWDVNEESPAEELQTCVTTCKGGRSGAGAGQFSGEGPHGVAVDNNEPLVNPSYGDVYVVDWENFRVQKFDPEGRFLLMFGGGVITGGATGTGDVTAGSNVVSSVATTSKAFLEGQTVTGAGIPAGTTIRGVGDESSHTAGVITLSQAATVSGTGVALTVAAGAGSVPNNEQQTVTIEGTPTGGTFTLTFISPQPDSTEATTAPIAPASGAGSVQASLEALSNIGAGNVAVSGPAGGPYTVEFKGARYADTNVKQLRPNEEGQEPGVSEHVAVATPVEGHSEPEVCATASICQGGAPGTADGKFTWSFEGSYIAVGPGGRVYVGDKGRVQVFEPSGTWKEKISPPSLNELEGEAFELQATALAVDSSGDMFVWAPGVEGVRELEANGTEKSTRFDKESRSVTSLAVDPKTGDLYVGDRKGGFHVIKYDPAGKELASFGSRTLEASEGMGFSDPFGELYAGGSLPASSPAEYRIFALTSPPPGPLLEPGTESGTPSPHGEATLEAIVDPEGYETSVHFEYVDDAHFQAGGYASATSTAPVSIGSGSNLEERFEEEHVEAKLPEGALVPGVTYHWRVVASNECEPGKPSCTSTGADQTLEETPSALVDGPTAADVTATSVRLVARIDPLGASTSYRLEYGTSTTYEHVLSGSIGGGEAYVPISYHVQGLEPNTSYHYRLVTTNQCVAGRTCTQEGADHTFMTQAASSEFALPDGRAWELVSPASTGGAVFSLSGSGIQAASDGGAITYPAHGEPLGEEVLSNSSALSGAQVVSRRAPSGWRSQDIKPPQSAPTEGSSTGNLILSEGVFSVFSPDLASAAMEPPLFTSLSTEALEGTPYVRNNSDGSYTPLLTTANTPPGTNLMEVEPPIESPVTQAHILGGTTDHVILGSWLKLTKEAVASAQGSKNLYEWRGGRLQLVNILPNKEPTHNTLESPRLAGEIGTVPRAVSNDGRRVAWTLGTPYAAQLKEIEGLFIRDMVEGNTVQLGGRSALYQTMSSDGSRVFFLENGDLYEYDANTGVQTDLTASHGAGEASAMVQESVSNVSEDGSYVYFVANGVLTATENAMKEKATSGADNVYMLHEAGGKWSTSYIATLSSQDSHSWNGALGSEPKPILGGIASRVSPDGRYLTFMSQRSLTGYDNVDANPEAYEMEEVEGQSVAVVDKEGRPVRAHDEEVFLYDSGTGRLVCVSCAPNRARPAGVFTGDRGLLVEGEGGSGVAWAQKAHPHWLAGSLPLWQARSSQDFAYQPRYLSDSGRLFFNSPDALVPQDTNGLEDVYQYEPPGLGGCTSTSTTFSAGTGGCTSLISSGTARSEAAFFDASETGDDVFFIAAQHLTPADTDTGYDVWDAHVCSAASPCLTGSTSPPACSSSDSCKAVPSPQPELFGPAPSATFSGVGNIAPVPAVVPKPLTRAQKLAKALAACRKKKNHKRRAVCEKQAKRAYGAPRKASKSSRRKGGK